MTDFFFGTNYTQTVGKHKSINDEFKTKIF